MIQLFHINDSQFKNKVVSFYTLKPKETVNVPVRDEYIAEICKTLNVSKSELIFMNQTHSDNIKIIETSTNNKELQNTDGIITDGKNICLCVLTADCAPILLFDPDKEVIASVHAGWKGTAKNIAGKTATRMNEEFGCNSKNIFAFIGPCISKVVYEVGQTVYNEFNKIELANNDIFKKGKLAGKYFCDIKEANKQLLLRCGIREQQIQVSGSCTYQESETFFSARKEGIETGRIISGIMLKD